MALRIVTSRLARATAQAAPGFYAGAARHMSQETDIVKDVFVEQQKKFRALLDATKDLEIPTSGDKAAIADYAQKRYDIMKKVSVRTRLRCTRTAVDGIVRARRRSDDRSPRVSFSVRASPEVEREIEPGQPGSTRPGGEGASRAGVSRAAHQHGAVPQPRTRADEDVRVHPPNQIKSIASS